MISHIIHNMENLGVLVISVLCVVFFANHAQCMPQIGYSSPKQLPNVQNLPISINFEEPEGSGSGSGDFLGSAYDNWAKTMSQTGDSKCDVTTGVLLTIIAVLGILLIAGTAGVWFTFRRRRTDEANKGPRMTSSSAQGGYTSNEYSVMEEGIYSVIAEDSSFQARCDNTKPGNPVYMQMSGICGRRDKGQGQTAVHGNFQAESRDYVPMFGICGTGRRGQKFTPGGVCNNEGSIYSLAQA